MLVALGRCLHIVAIQTFHAKPAKPQGRYRTLLGFMTPFGAGVVGKISIVSASPAFTSGAHGFPYLMTEGVLDESRHIRPRRVHEPNTATPD